MKPHRLPLLGLLCATFYTLFTLLPNSHSLMVSWPWVFLWQVGLLCPLLWLLLQVWQQRSWVLLGNGLDAIAGLTLVIIILNVSFAEFFHQAAWYGWVVICHLFALYALTQWCTREKAYSLLKFQAAVSIAFIAISLTVWGLQTVAPELTRLAELKAIGLDATFDLSRNNLRNWAPLGHQNYVAGYLVLALPILMGLTLNQMGWQRWVWGGGFVLGLIDLYTTNSRAGFLGGAIALLLVLLGFAVTQTTHRKKLRRLGIGLAIAGIAVVLANERLRDLATDALQGKGIVDDYRVITNTVGWYMGLSTPLTGQGLGSAPLVYQQYLPVWGGRRAELTYQLHSTLAQLWGELGVSGIILPIGVTLCLLVAFVRWYQRISKPSASKGQSLTKEVYTKQSFGSSPWIVINILSGLVGYTLVMLTDYQLDNPAISGTLALFLTILTVELRPTCTEIKLSHQAHYGLLGAVTALLLLVGTWLVPIHRAWQLSSQGFTALLNEDIPRFVTKLEKAHQLAPWEPYYAYQLAWNLGNLAYQASEMTVQETLRQQSVQWFQTAIAISPYREFGYSNLGWLQVNQAPAAATQAFVNSARLIPAKREVFLGLGYSLWQQNRTDLAIQAWGLEALRHPDIITSPLWQTPQLQTIYPQFLESLEKNLDELISQTSDPIAGSYWQKTRAGLHWWRNNLSGAEQDWAAIEDALGLILTKLAANQSVQIEVDALPAIPEKFTLQAWLDSDNREADLVLAWRSYRAALDASPSQAIPSELLSELVESMNLADNFDQWLKQVSPTRTIQSQRLGFNTLSRHTDGTIPSDFFLREERIALSYLFPSLFISPVYKPALDNQLQSLWDKVLKAV